MFRVLLALSLAATGLAAPTAAHAQKLGVVEVQKVMEAIPAWKTALELLRQDFETKKKTLEARQAELKKLHDQIEAKSTVSDPKTIQAERDKFTQTAGAFQQEFMKAQQDISQREAGLKETMLARIEQVVGQLASHGDYDFVLEAGAEATPNVLYMAKSVNVTDQTVALYKKMFGDQPITPPAKPAAQTPAKKP